MVPCDTPENIDLFEYLCLRIKQIGIRSVHGVPGDFNLEALDYIQKCGLQWVGSCNELNAGYAADGYARINGISALMTVMGVGELSAINAIAGMFLIHIVGKPSRQAQREKFCTHHTLGDGDFTLFEDMSRKVSCMTACIDNIQTAPALIDEAIRTCWIQSRPVFLFVSSDMISAPVSRELLKIRPPLDRMITHDDILQHDTLVKTVVDEIRNASRPVALVGGYGISHGAKKQLNGFLRALGIPVLTTASGIGIVDRTLPHYKGLYVGSSSLEGILKLIKPADLIISIGNIPSDLSSSSLKGIVENPRLIDIRRTTTKVECQNFENIHISSVLIALTETLNHGLVPMSRSFCVDHDEKYEFFAASLAKTDEQIDTSKGNKMKDLGLQFLNCLRNAAIIPRRISFIRSWIFSRALKGRTPITHDWLWSNLGNWLQEGDILLTEAGTASFGIWNTTLPPNIIFLAQYMWASIGYTVGACQGAALATRDSSYPRRRTILFIGDGSFQFSCQELSTIIRLGLKPIIFVICNNGFTIERLIHGEEQEYNDIQPWDHRLLPAAFGAAPGTYETHRVETREHLLDLWGCKTFNDCSVLQVSANSPLFNPPLLFPFCPCMRSKLRYMQIIELCVDQNDAPSNLVALAQSLRERNASLA
ncbi:pyruvate decarboxylase [Penicillium maclennaniae]|uniref:pyruvate decarboxylase n=1 Tax=Penicillium maclennaniae TaxID=1343394 RepID=UPI0025404AD9|nr:pyruvate decarboxylase [Penicillium maclennaniae]KAJ5670396.1 pyruvate decarboxylase [Penicillium maclennaniae]